MEQTLLEKKVRTYLFSSAEEIQAANLEERTRQHILRLQDMYFYWREHPRTPEREIQRELQRRYAVGKSVAGRDLAMLREILGSMSITSADYKRWVFQNKFDEAWELARQQGDAKAMSALLSTYGKVNRLDAPDQEQPAYAEIVPPFLTITADPSVAGFTPIPNAAEVAARLEKQYVKEVEQ